MRGIIGLGVFGLVCLVGFWFMTAEMNRELGPQVLVAFGEPSDGMIEVNVCIPLNMRKLEYIGEGDDARPMSPTEWAQHHWTLQDSAGDTCRITTIGSSLLVKNSKAGGAPDCWVKTHAKMGESYSLIYKPDLEDPKRFKFDFDAKAGLKPRQRVEFEEMK